MARNIHPLIHLQGTIHDLTFVNSKAYGPHVRARRGTYKTAPESEALQRNAKRTSLINQAAQPVHHFLKQIAGAFKQRDLWQAMLSRMRGTSSSEVFGLLSTLRGLEVNAAYGLERLGPLPDVTLTPVKKKFVVNVCFEALPHFPKKTGVDGYRFEVGVLWLDGEGRGIGHNTIVTEWGATKNPATSFRFEQPKPAKAVFYVLLLKVEGGRREEVVDSFAAKGMRVVDVGTT